MKRKNSKSRACTKRNGTAKTYNSVDVEEGTKEVTKPVKLFALLGRLK